MAYKVFTNGSPLPASDLNDYLMKQSVMVFANSTARSAALTAPTEGMCVYLEDVNAFQIYSGTTWVTQNPITTQGDLIVGNSSGEPSRLALGSNGTVLTSNGTTATWSAAPGGESWSSLASGSITTGAATWSLSGFASRAKYVLVLSGLSSSTAGAALTLTFNGTSANYCHGGVSLQSPSTYAASSLSGVGGTGEANIPLGAISASASSAIRGSILVTNANSSSANKFYNVLGSGTPSGSNGHQAHWIQGVWEDNTAITSFSLTVSAGTIDAGTYELLGSN